MKIFKFIILSWLYLHSYHFAQSPIFRAVKRNDVETVQELLDEGFCILEENKKGYTLVQLAKKHKLYKLADYLEQKEREFVDSVTKDVCCESDVDSILEKLCKAKFD